MRRLISLAVCLCVSAVVSTVANAQPKPGYSPSSTHIFPAGGRRGTKVKVRVGAECTPPGTQFRVFGKGVETDSILEVEASFRGEASPQRKPTQIPITYPREWEAEIAISEDVESSIAFWRLSSAQGGTGSRPFLIGDLPEFIETESNSVFDRAEPVELPVTINGQIHGERDVDHYRFVLSANSIVSCEVIAGRIGSKLDPVISLLDKTGTPVKMQRLHVGTDPVLVFHSKVEAEFVLRVSHITHRGDPSFVYRINLLAEPFTRVALPGGLQADQSATLRVYSFAGVPGPMIELMNIAVGESRHRTQYAFNLQEDHSPVTLSIDRHPVTVESEPNDAPAKASPLTLPTVAYGQFARADDKDVFRISCSKGERLRFECRAWPPGTPAMPTLKIVDAGRKSLGGVKSVESADSIGRMTWTAPADGDFTVEMSDLRFGAQGGFDFVYRLEIAEDKPDFELSIATDSLTITQDKTAQLQIDVRRHGNLKEAIALKFEGLPEGVEVENAEIPKGKSTAKIKLKASADAPSESHVLRVTGEVKVGEETIEHTAMCRHLGVDSEGVSIGPGTTERLHLTVQHKPLFRLFCPEAYLYAHRGSIFPYPMEIERLDGFDGDIRVQQGDRQNRDMDGVTMLDTVIRPGKSDFFLPIYLPETMAINVQSQSQLYCQAWARFKDHRGKDQSMLILSEKRNMLRTLPPVTKLNAVKDEVTSAPGGTANVDLKLERTTNFPGELKLELHPPTPGVRLQEATIPAGESELSVKLDIEKTMPESEAPVFVTIRGTGLLDDEIVIVTETRIRLQLVSGVANR